MKSILASLISLSCLVLAPLRAGVLLQPNDFVAVCGDSITEQKIYSVLMEDYFLMCQPVSGLRTAQFGWGGEQASGFSARIGTDVLPFQPTVATTCYGMNDGHYIPMTQATGDLYRQNLTASVEKLKAGGIKTIVVGSPGCVDTTTFKKPSVTADAYNKTLDALRGIAEDVAQKEGVSFADLHTPMMQVMAKAKAAFGDAYPLCGGDGIHPGQNGHLVMAYAFLKALGCDGAIGTITVDLNANTAEGTPGQKIDSCQDGAVEVESTRYPFCFQGDPAKPDQLDAGVVKFFPFNDDLNRYMLVVKGIKGSKAKVTWGTVSKEFSAADLAKGINLADEFLVNPFCEQFNKVTAAVQAQQVHETFLVKQFLHMKGDFAKMAPNAKPELDKVAADGIAHDKELFDAAAALVIPVHHTIKIESLP